MAWRTVSRLHSTVADSDMAHTVARAIVLLATSLAFGETPQTRVERLEDLIREALRANPEVHMAERLYQAASQRPSREAALPDPKLAVGYQSVGRPYPLAGIGAEPMANLGFMYTQEFPAPGKRRLRAAIAYQDSQAVLQEYLGARLRLISQLKQAYYQLSYTWAASEVLERNRRLLEQILEVSQARYGAGLVPQQDVLKAQTELTLLEARHEEILARRRLHEAELRQLLARPARSPLGQPQPLRDPEDLPPVSRLLEAAARNSPLLAGRESAIAGAELALNLARKDFYPDWALSGGYFNMGRMGSMYMFRAEFTLPLFAARKQRPGVSEAYQRLIAERRRYEAEALQLRLRIEQEYLAADRSARLARIYSAAAIPQAQLTLESSLASYQTGAVNMLAVLSNFASVLDYELGYWNEVVSYYSAVSRLEELTGEVLLK